MKYLNFLTILFIVLKLAEVISWSWWIVFLPTIIWFAAAILFISVAAFIQWRIQVLTDQVKYNKYFK